MRSRWAIVLSLLLAAPVLAGCIQTAEVDPATTAPVPAVGDLHSLDYDVTGAWSKTVTPGIHTGLPVEVALVPSFDGTNLRIGVYRPDVPEGTKVPVIVDAGPYYGNGEGVVESPTGDRLAQFLIENYVPHGYAVVLAAIRGTGDSGGCVELMSEAEQKDLDALVTYLGTQEWSNGNVGMIGKSYDGTTPWMAAQFGNKHLKTIVPISGLTSIRDLMFHNGSAESRGPIMHNVVYWPFGFTTEGRSPENQLANICPEAAAGAAMGPWAVASGNGASPLGYWEVRDFRAKTLENYNGSVFIIHGLQDWNVEPSMIAPFYNELTVDKKMWLGQWGHHYPDSVLADGGRAHPSATRFDWAETLLRWFDKYLKGVENLDTGPALEIEDHYGTWRVEPANAYPPLDAQWTLFNLSGDGTLATGEAEAGSFRLVSNAHENLFEELRGAAPMTEAVFETAPFTVPMRISGLPQLHVTAVPTGPGGHLFAQLFDVHPGGEAVLVGHAQMDLRFADGGLEMKPVVPGMPLVAKMEFFAFEAPIEEGHALRLVITQESQGDPGSDPIVNPTSPVVELQVGGGVTSILNVPVVVRDEAAFDAGWKPPVTGNAGGSGGA